MKKLLSLALALVLCLSLTIPAMAEEDDCLKLEAGATAFTINGITFTLSNPVSGQVADDNATAPRTGEIINVVPAGTKITFSPAPDNIDELVMVEVVSRDEENPDAVVWGEVAVSGINGGIIDDILLLGSMGEDDEPVVYIRAEAAQGENAEGTESSESTETPAAPVNPFTDVADSSPFYNAILWAVDQGITNGTTPTTFGPGSTCTVRQILTFLCRANTGNPAATLDAAAAWAVEQGMISEGDDTTAPCTRAMAVTFMWKAAGSPETEAEVSFTDVAEDADYIQAVAWAVSMKVTSGTGDGTTFSPDNTCTRGQIVTFLYRADQAAQAAE